MTLPVVHVTWRDSEAENSWTPISEVSEELDLTHTVGFLIKETESHLLIALSYDSATQSINCFKRLPRACIEEMRILCRLKTDSTT